MNNAKKQLKESPDNEQLINKVELYTKLKEDFETGASNNLYNISRKNIEIELGLRYHTTEELTEFYAEEAGLSKNWDDSKKL